MIYEWRVYQIEPGKMPIFTEKFGRLVVPLFEQTGVRLAGAWQNVIGNTCEFIYLLAWENLAEYEQTWPKVYSHELFLKYRQEDAKDGPLVGNISNRILRPTPYSALK